MRKTVLKKIIKQTLAICFIAVAIAGMIIRESIFGLDRDTQQLINLLILVAGLSILLIRIKDRSKRY
jgi:hypothetical protein